MTSKKDHIAIIGAGFSGLASAYLLSKEGFRVTVYDPAPIGENASGISAGLLHCYTGPKAKPPENAENKLQSTLELLHVSSEIMGSSVFKKTGLFRPALSIKQEAAYKQRSNQDSMIQWLSKEEIHERCPQLSPFPGIWIADGYQINTKMYLKGLWKICLINGAKWKSQSIHSTENLKEDKIVITTGATPLDETSALPVHPIKGQILEVEWDIPLPFPISANIYFVPSISSKRCFIGGTFEHHFKSPLPDIAMAKELLIPKIENLFPNISSLKIIKNRAALRGSTPNRLPILKQISSKTWVLVGMGSKGLLNHAYYAKKLAKAIQF